MTRKAARSPVEFEDPPETRVKYDWPLIADKLRAHPMRWAKVFDLDRTSVVNAIRQGAIAAVKPDLGFEVRTANNQRSPRRCTLYMRYNPDKEDSLKAAIQSNRKDKK